MPSSVPAIDLSPWFGGDEAARAAVAAEVDAALRSVGFFLISGHGVPDDLRPPIGQPNDYAPVVSAQFLKERLDAITIG